jgi:photosystem II stability/assembly factor-like uncharacterized protein
MNKIRISYIINKKQKYFLKFLILSVLLESSILSSAQNFHFVSSVPVLIGSLNSVYFPAIDTGYAVGSYILVTNDSGNTWITQNSNTNQTLFSVHFINSLTGWAVGDSGTIIKTINGGSSWFSQNYGNYNYRSVYFIDKDTGYVAGIYNWSGVILKTTNGGNNWSVSLNSAQCRFLSINFKSANTGFATSECDTVFMTTNGGNTWTKTFVNIIWGFTSKFPSSNVGYISSVSGIAKTTNGGNTWYIVNQNNYVSDFLTCYFTSADTGYFTGYISFGDSIPIFGGSYIFKTTDGGITLKQINNVAQGYVLNSMFFTNSNTGYIVGGYPNWPPNPIVAHAIVLKTTDGGSSWIENNLLTHNKDFEIFPNPANNKLFIELQRLSMSEQNTISIYSIIGHKITEQHINQIKTEIDISGLSKGIYILKLINSNKTEFRIFIKE